MTAQGRTPSVAPAPSRLLAGWLPEALLTSNRPVDDWGKLLGDTAAVTALLDRLLHHAHVLKCGPPELAHQGAHRFASRGADEVKPMCLGCRQVIAGFEMSTEAESAREREWRNPAAPRFVSAECRDS